MARKTTRKRRRTGLVKVCDEPAMAEMSPRVRKSGKSNKEIEELLRKEITSDVAAVNMQVNQILMTIGVTTKLDEVYTLRQQMLELLRFKYNIIDNY